MSRVTGAAPARAQLPAYLRIVAELRTEIHGGRYRIGERLGTESALCERFGVSRFTVRAALSQLEHDGVVSRHPGVGIIVAAHAPAARYSVSVGSLSELMVFLDSTIVKVVGRDTVRATAGIAHDLGCQEGDRWLRLKTVRTPEGGAIPISWTEYWLRPRFDSIVAHVGTRAGPVYPLLVERFGVVIDDIEQDIGAAALPAPIARRIAAQPQSPALRVIHRFVSRSEGILYLTVSLYPAERFRYVQKLRGAAT